MARGASWSAWAGVCVLLAWAGWRALTLGAADELAIDEPGVALGWRDDQPRAVFEQGQREWRSDQSAVAATAGMQRALALNPLDGRAYRILAEIAERHGDMPRATQLFRLTAERAPRDLPGREWLVQDALRRHDGVAAIHHLDYLLRVEPEKLVRFEPLLRSLALFGPTQPPLAAALSRRPAWRTTFMAYLLNQRGVSDAITPLVKALDAGPAGLDRRERADWIDRLAADGHPDQAYIVWVEQLPEARRARLPPLFNGNFSEPVTNEGFGWRLDNDHGAQVDRSVDERGQPAIRLAFDGRKVPASPLRQRLLLAPGGYRLSGRVRLNQLSTAQGLQWRLVCEQDARPLGASALLNGNSDWTDLAGQFEVPGDCASQWFELRVVARAPVEQRIEGEAWFSDLELSRDQAAVVKSGGLR